MCAGLHAPTRLINMDGDLMFRMEEVSNTVPPLRQGQRSQRATSVSDEEDEYYPMCPITEDLVTPAKDICDYLQNLLQNGTPSNSQPKNSFTYLVSLAVGISSPLSVA